MTNNTDRTAKATAARMRAAEEKKAAVLRERGWVCIPPEDAKTYTERSEVAAVGS